MRRRFVVTAVLAAGLVSGCAYLDVKQREWIFRVERGEGAHWSRHYSSGVSDVEELWIAHDRDGRPAGERLHAWWLPGPHADSPALLYLHGARWDLARNAFRIARLREMGFAVLAVDYRGFGRSSGTLPSESQTYEDAALAWSYLKGRVPDPARRFVYGHSLGGAVAIDLVARDNDAAGLIVESTFTSIREMAELTWARWLPLSIVLTQRFDSLDKVGRVRVPTLFVHGKSDRFVPHAMTERLFNASRAPKQLLLAESGSHSNVTVVAFAEYARAVRDLVRTAHTAITLDASGGADHSPARRN